MAENTDFTHTLAVREINPAGTEEDSHKTSFSQPRYSGKENKDLSRMYAETAYLSVWSEFRLLSQYKTKGWKSTYTGSDVAVLPSHSPVNGRSKYKSQLYFNHQVKFPGKP